MNRPIKFRAWDIIRKEMLYLNEGLSSVPYYELFCDTPDKRALNLMQFTGLKDRNGKEIFEGDIVSWGSMNWTHAEIRFGSYIDDNGYGHYGYYAQQGGEVMHFNGDGGFEVVGNIYENPELLTPVNE